MEFEFKYENTELQIETENSGNKISAMINGKSLEAQIVAISENHLILNNCGTAHKAFVCADDSRLLVHIDGRIVELARIDAERKSFSAGDHEFGAKDRVMSPMPGKVVKILVDIGDTVVLRQPLVIVESMKMENEIKSPSAGKIKEICFSAGDLVGTGQPIILLEPEE